MIKQMATLIEESPHKLVWRGRQISYSSMQEALKHRINWFGIFFLDILSIDHPVCILHVDHTSSCYENM